MQKKRSTTCLHVSLANTNAWRGRRFWPKREPTERQSPDDLEAFREKAGCSHRGYVANITEYCDYENSLQLITKVQVEPNNTDDAQILVEALPHLSGAC
jgi:hypothetical protein